MYTYIPVPQAIDLMCLLLRENNIHPDFMTEFRLLDLACLQRNVYEFRGDVYGFPDGLPMGNPLSPIVADVYMSVLELNLFNNQLHNLAPPPEIHTWIRYVDDIFCI